MPRVGCSATVAGPPPLRRDAAAGRRTRRQRDSCSRPLAKARATQTGDEAERALQGAWPHSGGWEVHVPRLYRPGLRPARARLIGAPCTAPSPRPRPSATTAPARTLFWVDPELDLSFVYPQRRGDERRRQYRALPAPVRHRRLGGGADGERAGGEPSSLRLHHRRARGTAGCVLLTGCPRTRPTASACWRPARGQHGRDPCSCRRRGRCSRPEMWLGLLRPSCRTT